MGNNIQRDHVHDIKIEHRSTISAATRTKQSGLDQQMYTPLMFTRPVPMLPTQNQPEKAKYFSSPSCRRLASSFPMSTASNQGLPEVLLVFRYTDFLLLAFPSVSDIGMTVADFPAKASSEERTSACSHLSVCGL